MAIPNPDGSGSRVCRRTTDRGKWPVADGGAADIAVVVACDENGELALFLAELPGTRGRRT